MWQKQLLCIKATGTVDKEVRPPPPDLWLKTGKDQLYPTWQLISPYGNH